MLGFIEEAKSEGAKLITGGGSPPSVDKGYFVQPTVFEVEPSERPRFDAHDRFHARLLLHRVPAAACADTRPLLALICVVVADHSIWKDEVFGPVLGVKSFSTEEEAIALANDTSYGLAANVFSKDDDRGNRVASRLRAGKVFQNQSTFNFPGISQHGYKKSGLGTEGGLVGLLEYLEIKSVAKNKGTNRPANFMREVATAEATARL